MNLDFIQKSIAKPRSSQLRPEKPYRWDNLHKTQLHTRLALDTGTQHDAFALRYKSYLADGYIDSNTASLFFDSYDKDQNSRTIVVYSGTEAVASARISVMETLNGSHHTSVVPGYLVFPDEIADIIERIPEVSRPKRAMEITRLVRHPDLAESYNLIFLMLRLIGQFVIELDVDVVLSCVRRNHVPFYSRFYFRTINGPKSYPNLKFPTYLLACSRLDYDNVRRIIPPLYERFLANSIYSELARGNDIPISMHAVA